MFLDVFFSNERDFYETLLVLSLKKSIIQPLFQAANVTNVTIYIAKCVQCYFCFVLQYPF